MAESGKSQHLLKRRGLNVDLVPILRDMGVIGRTQGRELVTHCPFHSDRSPSFAINLETGLWICYTGCGQGNIQRLAQKLGYPRLKLDARLASGLPIDPDDLIKEILAPPPTTTDQQDNNYYVPPITIFKEGVMPRWFLKRGFTPEIIQDWQLRYDQLEKAVVIPAFDDYNVQVALIKRYPAVVAREKRIAKYRYTTGFQKARHLFGMNVYDGQDTVALVEGPLDCIWVWEHWGPCLALLGATLSEWQMRWLKNLDLKEIVLAFDDDDAGRELTWGRPRRRDREPMPPFAQRIGVYTSVISLPQGKKDVQECSPQEVKKAFRERRSTLMP